MLQQLQLLGSAVPHLHAKVEKSLQMEKWEQSVKRKYGDTPLQHFTQDLAF
jgi:hypothetical protein